MKIERGEVERLLAWAQQDSGPDTNTVAELCRTWLAVQDAPVGRVKEVGGSLVMIGELAEPFRADARPVRLVRDGGA